MRNPLRNLTLLVALLLLHLGTWAQVPAWQTAVAFASQTSQSNVVVMATAADANGNVYLAGNLEGTVSFSGTTLVSSGSFDVFVAKWSPATSRFVWAQRLGGAGGDLVQKIAVTSAGVFVAGYFSSATFAAGSVALANQGSSGSDIFVVKLTDAGASASVAWAQRAGGTGFDYAYGLAVSGSSVYLTGSFLSATAGFGSITLTNSSTAVSADMYVAKLTDAGTTASFAWARQTVGATGTETGQAVAVSGPNVYVVGQFNTSTSVAFGSTTLTPSNATGSSDLFVTKLTDGGTTGSFGWALRAGGTDNDRGQAVAVNGSTVYVSGQVSGTSATFGSSVLPIAGDYDGFIAKLTDAGSSGSFGWAQGVGGGQGDAITTIVVQGSQLYCAGFFGSSLSNPGVVPMATFGSTTLQSAGFIDAFVSKLADAGSSGSFVWTQQAGGTQTDYINGLVLVGASVYAAGVSYSPTCAFGTLTLANPQSPSGTGFLASLADPTLAATTAANPLERSTIFPNPAYGTATVRLPAGTAPATLTLLDALGRVVRTTAASAGQDYPLSLAGLAPGVYALRVQAGEAQAVQRLVVE